MTTSLQNAADAAAMAASVSRESLRLLLDRLLPAGAPDAVPSSAATVSPALLTSTVSTAYPGMRVAETELLDGHSGTTERARIALHYADDRSAANGTASPTVRTDGDDGPPGSLFVKTAPAGAGGRLFVNLMNLASSEVRFYREIAPSVPIRIPHAWHAEHRAATGAFVLILEDLAARGARFTDVSDRADLDTARRVVTTLGRLHAAFWQCPRFETDLAWLRAPGPRPGLRIERFLCRSLAGRGVSRFADAIPERIRDSTKRIVEARDRLEQAWAEGPMTLLHGDSHIGNMFFIGETVGLLDWQVTQRGQGMRDVSYFLVNSVPTEIRREHERELIELWRSVLDDAGVRAPSFDDAWRQHRLHAAYTWIGTSVTAAAPQLQPEPIARAGIVRASRALLDLDSLGALTDIGA